jgi:protein TonB
MQTVLQHKARTPSLLAVLAGHALLLWALLQLMAPMPQALAQGVAMVAWLSLHSPAPPAMAAALQRPVAAPRRAPAVAVEQAAAQLPAATSGPAFAPMAETTPVPAAPPAPLQLAVASPAPAPTPAPSTPAAPAPSPEPVITRPDHADCHAPPHPALLRERGVEGVVRLRVQVDSQGRAAAVQLQASSGWRLFDEAALAQVRGCRFQPARHNGVAVDSWVEFPMRFALAG